MDFVGELFPKSFPRLSKEAGNSTQIRTKRPEFPEAVVFSSSRNSSVVNLPERLLLQPRLAAVGYGLVERLEGFERGLVAFLRARAEVFVEPPVRRAPGVGIFLAQLLGEVFPDVRMSVQGFTIYDFRMVPRRL